MSEPAANNPQARLVARPKQPVVRQRPGQGTGSVPDWMRAQGRTVSQAPLPNASYQGTRKVAPVAAPLRPPFIPLDRLHPSQWFGKVLSLVSGVLPQDRRASVALVAVPIVVYLSGALFFSGHFLPGTHIDGVDASWKTPAAVAALARTEVEGYQLDIGGDGLSLTIDGAEVGLSLDEDSFAAGAAELTPSLSWPLSLLGNRDQLVSQGVGYDDEQLRALVSAAVGQVNEGAEPTKNAGLAYDEQSRSFVVVDEQQGTMIDEETVLSGATKAVSTLQDKLTLGEGALVQPTLRADDPRMKAALEQADARQDLSLQLTVWGNTVRTLDAHNLHSWFALDDSCEVTGDLDAITAWAQGPLSEELDSVGAKRAYVRPDDGKYIEVQGGTYGWIIDGADLAQTICDRIKTGSNEPVEVPMRLEGDVFAPGKQDWGPRYLDVDLSEQFVRLFDEGSNIIWESECVSGDVGLGRDTVTGVYTIYDKESPTTLIGADTDNDGEPDYESEVEYWMPFYDGYGLHDASWRGYFGPDAYLYAGSHGCINLPTEAAAELYSLISVDDVVVVHY